MKTDSPCMNINGTKVVCIKSKHNKLRKNQSHCDNKHNTHKSHNTVWYILGPYNAAQMLLLLLLFLLYFFIFIRVFVVLLMSANSFICLC